MTDGQQSVGDVAPASAKGTAPRILVVMGVSGSGKTTIAKGLARRLQAIFADGDDFHPPENVAKMSAGIPLTDADRAPWLAAIAAWIDARRAAGERGVVACSALKRAYRRVLVGDRRDVGLVYLSGRRDVLARRMSGRRKHFMPTTLLDSQIATLEPPGAEEHPITVDVARPPRAIVETVAAQVGA